jgi:adhesin transport system outer membrane protein
MDSSIIESFNLTQSENKSEEETAQSDEIPSPSIKEETKKEDSNIVETKTKELMEEKPLNKSEIESLKKELTNLEDKNVADTQVDNLLLSASKDSFTINLATFSSLTRAQNFVIDNDLGSNAFIYEFGADKKYAKVIYGIYKTSKEATLDMEKFNKEILKNKPLINRVKKHQELYSKYN